MRKTRFHCLLGILLFTVASPVLAQQAPNLERGFAADKMYELSNIDNVNVFNGNLFVSLPIGQRFPLSTNLSYGLSLTYNSKLWDFGRQAIWGYPCGECNYQFMYYEYEAYANRRSNAGLGWLFSIGGRLHGLDDDIGGYETSTGWLYESPDGAEHAFYGEPHNSAYTLPSDPIQPESGIFYTNDGSYLRQRIISTTHVEIDFPDGTTNEFDKATDGTWQLTRRRDQFQSNGNYVNWVKVTYDTSSPNCPAMGTSAVWIIEDSQQRRHDVCFSTAYYEDHNIDVPVSAVLTGFGGGQSVHYSFAYSQEDINRSYFETYTKASPTVNVPTLTSVTLPSGAAFSMAYKTHYAFGESQTAGQAGTIQSIVLPTGGKYAYDYEAWEASANYLCPSDPNNPANDNTWSEKTTGIKTKHEFDAASSEVATWQYIPVASQTPGYFDCTTEGGDFIENDLAPNAELAVTVITPAKHKNIHYFTIWPGYNNHQSDWNGFKPSEYGLPITRNPDRVSSDGLPLSTESYECDSAGNNCVLKRQTFATYGADTFHGAPASTTDRNRHITLERTVFHDDGDKYVQTAYEGEDGFGHQRTATTTGTFGSDIKRSTFTNYNPGSDANGHNGSALYFPSNGPWILNTFTDSSVTQGEGSSAVTTQAAFCFDPANGFLLGRKATNSAYASPQTHRADVVALYQKDTMGNVTREDWFGGDTQDASAMTSLCATTSTTSTYRIDHTYAKGVLEGTRYKDPLSGNTILRVVDQTIDSTGLVWKSRDHGAVDPGVETVFNYDSSGRVTSATTPGTADVAYEYHNPGETGYTVPTAIATVTSSVSGNSMTHQIEYDSFGRVKKETRSIDGGTTSRVTAYDASGQTKAVTEWETNPASDASTHATKYTYDAFGRPLTVTAPDNSVRTFSYLGARQLTRRELIGTAATPADTVETYDVHGRLGSVLDANGFTTTYTYDAGNRLAAVSMAGQPRTFTYDNLGFLRSETHPENGTTTYGDYDARGHAGSKSVNGANTEFDLQFVYDKAERPFQISSRNPNAPTTFRLSKEFTYATTTPDLTHATAGRLITTMRNNYAYSGANPLSIAEAYSYDAAGRLSEKDTTIDINAVERTFLQTYAYNDLGLLSQIEYPYASYSGTPPWDVLTPEYTKGRFSGAHVGNDTNNHFTNSISYWDNGMLDSITHSNGVTDTYAIDTTTHMPRPSQIKFENWTGCAAPAITAQSSGSTIAYGSSLTISVTATGDNPTYQWYTGQSPNTQFPITGATSASYAVPSTQNGSYWLRAANACGHADSATITINVQLAPPTALVADRVGGSIKVTWQPSTGATSYQVFREAGGQWSLLGTSSSASFPDNSPLSNATAAYRVAALATNAVASNYSNMDIESTITFTSVTPGMAVTYAQLDELRAGLNAVRWAAGDSRLSWPQVLSQPGCPQTAVAPQYNGPILTTHLLALRCAMDTTLWQRFGIPRTGYTDPDLAGVRIKAVHLTEIQQKTDYQGDNR